MKGISGKECSRVDGVLRDAISEVENLKTIAEEYKAARSERWCESEAGEEYENKIEQLGDIVCTLNDAADELADLIQGD